MAIVKLKQNQVGPWSNSGTIFTAFEWGTQFRITADRYLRTLDWGRIQVGATHKPTTLRLWNQDTGSLVYSAPTIPDNGAVGLQTHEVTTEVHLAPGFEGVISTAMPAGAAFGFIDADPVTPPVPFEYLSPDTVAIANTGFPTAPPGDTTWHFWHDIGLDVFPPSTLVPTIANIEEQFESWLSQSQGTRPTDSFPELNHVLLTAINTISALVPAEHAAVLAAVTAGGGITAIGRLATILGLLEGATGIAANLAAVHAALTQDGAYDAVGTDVENLRQQQLLEAGARNIPPSAVGWTEQAVITDTGSRLWVEPADAYLFTMLDQGDNLRFYMPVGAGSLINWRAWAKPWDGTFWYPEHVQVNGPDCVIRGFGRWPGIGLYVPQDVEWELKAMIYTGS